MKIVPKFSTKPIKQTIPGQDIGISITMTPEPCPPARVIDPEGELVVELGCGEEYQLDPCPPCLCAPVAVGWSIQPTPAQTYIYYDPNLGLEYERHAWVTPDLIDAYIDGDSDTNAAGLPSIMRMATLPMYGDFTEATPPAYTNPHQSWLFLGLPFGDANDIRWEWTWDISQNLPTEPDDIADPESECWWAGEETEQVGSFLQVRILHGYYDSNLSGDWSAILTAKAYCGETEKGTLTLKIAMLNKYYY